MSAPAQPTPPRPVGGQVLRRFLGRGLNRLALGAIGALVLVALFADFLASDRPIYCVFQGQSYWFPNIFGYAELQVHDNHTLVADMADGDWALVPLVPWGYNQHDLLAVLSGPSGAHWLGTDPGGRDVLSRVIHGTRVSLLVSVLAVSLMTSVGVFLGSVAGYFGGWTDVAVNRVVEVINSLPSLLVLLALLAVLEPEGWGAVVSMVLVIGLLGWTGMARLVRGEILRVRALEFVEASRASGATHSRILLLHVIPNAINPVLVSATFAMASTILTEAALSFLGFGIPVDLASWGGMLADVRSFAEAWWLALFPGAAIFVTVLAYNLAGEGLRDAADPRLSAKSA